MARTPIPLPKPAEVAIALAMGIAIGVWVLRCYRRGWVKLNYFEKPFTRQQSPVAFWICIVLYGAIAAFSIIAGVVVAMREP